MDFTRAKAAQRWDRADISDGWRLWKREGFSRRDSVRDIGSGEMAAAAVVLSISALYPFIARDCCELHDPCCSLLCVCRALVSSVWLRSGLPFLPGLGVELDSEEPRLGRFS